MDSATNGLPRRRDESQAAGYPVSAPTTYSICSHCNLPPWMIASPEFQEHPQPLEIGQTLITDRRLWQRLAAIDSPEERGNVFHDYLSVKFRLHEWAEHEDKARAGLRHSYVRVLRDWGVDSNGPAGASLKAWAESRFGLRPTYHRGRLADDPQARAVFSSHRTQSSTRFAGLYMQLDLLYTFTQQELARRHPDINVLTLYRGTHDPEEYSLGDDTVEKQPLVTLNNLSSFTSDREVAWEFGSSVWSVSVPLSKIVFFSGLLPSNLLLGEREYLVLGGQYRVKPLRY